MGFDAAAVGLGELFGFDAFAGVGAEIGADLGFGAADAAAFGAADAGAAAGAADLGGAAIGADLAGGAADLGALGAGGLGVADALGAGATDIGAAGAIEGAGGFATDAAAATAAADAGSVGTAALPGAGTIDAGTALAGSPNIDAELGAAGAQPIQSGATTASAVQGANPSVTGGIGSDFAASGGTGMGAEISPDTMVANAQEAGAAAAAPQNGIGATLSSLGDKAGGLLGNKALQLGLPLGVLGYDLMKGPAKIPSNAEAAIANAQAGSGNRDLFNQTAKTDLNLANNFQISPAQAASIETWKQNQYNQLFQQIANQGNSDPTKTSEWVQGKNQIDQQALSQQVQMVNQLVTTAFQAAGASNAETAQLDGVLMQAAQIQIQQDAAFQQSVSSALQSFGLIAALSGKFGGSGATA